MVTMLFNEALQGVSHWFQKLSYKIWSFPLAGMAANRERELLKHVKNLPSTRRSMVLSLHRSPSIVFIVIQLSTYMIHFSVTFYLNAGVMLHFFGKIETTSVHEESLNSGRRIKN